MPQGSDFKSCQYLLTMSELFEGMLDVTLKNQANRIYFIYIDSAGHALVNRNEFQAVNRMLPFLDRTVAQLLEERDALLLYQSLIEHIMGNLICLEDAEEFDGLNKEQKEKMQYLFKLYYRAQRIFDYGNAGLDNDAIIALLGDGNDDDDDNEEQGGGAGKDDEDEQGEDSDACDAADDADCEIDPEDLL